MLEAENILGVRVHATSCEEATRQVIRWAKAGESRMVCSANVQMIMEANTNACFRNILNQADLVTSACLTLVWMLRLLGLRNQVCVSCHQLIKQVLRAAEKNGLSVGFFGSKPEVLEALIYKLQRDYPGLAIVYAGSRSAHSLREGGRERTLTEIRLAAPQILFVSLGTPKGEHWISENREALTSVMVGVGKALDDYAVDIVGGPVWVRKLGLAWFFKILKEPRPVWRRVIKDYPRFIWHAFLQLVGKDPAVEKAP